MNHLLHAIVKESSSTTKLQGGNFHLKVGGAKSSGNAGDPMLGVAESVMDIITQTTTTRWEVVKNSASPKRPFFF